MKIFLISLIYNNIIENQMMIQKIIHMKYSLEVEKQIADGNLLNR